MESSNSQETITNLQFHTKAFWDNFYKNINKDNYNIDWYFDLTKVKINDFSLINLSKDEEILLLGAGLSSILDYLNNYEFNKVVICDFSKELKNILTERYNKEWEIECYDITTKSFPNEFNTIIDKGCLDCILSDIKEGETKFITALKNLLISLNEDGVLYYFSDGKLEDRINLFYQIPQIKYKVSTINMNEFMKDEYREFSYDDNLYYLYTITRSS